MTQSIPSYKDDDDDEIDEFSQIDKNKLNKFKNNFYFKQCFFK